MDTVGASYQVARRFKAESIAGDSMSRPCKSRPYEGCPVLGTKRVIRAFYSVCLLAVGAINLIARLAARMLEQSSGRLDKSPLHRSLMRTDLGRSAACSGDILSVADKPCKSVPCKTCPVLGTKRVRRAFASLCLLAVGAINLIARLAARMLELSSGRLDKSPLHRSQMRTDLGRSAACSGDILSVADKPCKSGHCNASSFASKLINRGIHVELRGMQHLRRA